MTKIFQFTTFDWNKGNLDKNWKKHNVSNSECEEVFFNEPLLISEDEKYSQKEKRLQALGKTENNRLLFISFTIRNNNIRIISARNMSRKEKQHYEKA
ncbi:hypothetical protein CL632_01980 [bacterium]|jgi:hypothetical protein|nr:hypothetical protein [bacterium]MDP6571312.1 BrnT family toxin [Patescibacteria group bacterium]MDP6756334.1 BrnT family toxin [Patescibacteria group bacterium]|tara:strand:- start:27533 stop:27826 length:294 start_codon:yes stop_codon:yes gene_type:complete